VNADRNDVSSLIVYAFAEGRDLTKLLQKLGQYDLAAAIEKGEMVLTESRLASTVSQDIRDAIAALTDSNNLQKSGLQLTPTGQITNPGARSILLNARQLAALRGLVSASQQPQLA
jgi:hypothetical protein